MRVFAYCRVSTTEQTTENQVLSIKRAGWDVPDHRVVHEQVSGSKPAMQRTAFAEMVQHKLEPGDTLVVLKLDRLGRDNIDVQNTINLLQGKGVQVVCLDLPVHNLSSAEGKLMLQMFSAFAEFERNRIRERTQEGLARVKAEGRQLGRPEATGTTEDVQRLRQQGLSQSKVAAKLGLGIATVKRHWNKGQEQATGPDADTTDTILDTSSDTNPDTAVINAVKAAPVKAKAPAKRTAARASARVKRYQVQYRSGGQWVNGSVYNSKAEADKAGAASGRDYQTVPATV